MELEEFYGVVDRMDPRLSRDFATSLYEVVGGKDVTSDAEVTRLLRAHRYGSGSGIAKGMSLARAAISSRSW